MGRKNKNYQKDLRQQAYERLKSMEAYGESKKEAMRDGITKEKIYSYNTFNTYWKHIRYYVDWVKKEHPEVTTLKSAKKYVNEWLDHRAASYNKKGEPLSAWTIHTEAKALGKLFGITPDDPDYYTPPVRERKNIKRSRSSDVARDAHFSEDKNAEFVTFCKATGLRRSELTRLTGKDLCSRFAIEKRITDLQQKKALSDSENSQLKMLLDTRLFPDADFYVYVKRGKGGRQRLVPLCIEPESTEVVINKMKTTDPEAKVWTKVPTNADIHSYRASYCCELYKKYTKNQSVNELPYDAVNKGTGHRYQSGVYICRKDNNKRYIRDVMLLCSKALGHNRINIIAENYLWQL